LGRTGLPRFLFNFSSLTSLLSSFSFFPIVTEESL
jgi:hypothetical protein